MADAATPSAAPTTFAEFEAAGGKYNAPPEPEKPAEPVEAVEESTSEAQPPKGEAETAAEPETAETKPQEKPEKKPPQPQAKPKLTLADEHARLLKEVTELRRERRELQQQPQPTPSPPAPQAGPAAAEDKPPLRPKLSTFQGSLEEYEKAVDAYEEDLRKWQDRQYEKREAASRAKAEQERIQQSYGAKLAEHLKAHPDYDAEIGQTPMSALMVDIVFHEGPELGQALIADKDNARRISQLPRDIQIFEMGRLAATLGNGNGTAQAVPEVETPAPEPVKVPAKVGASSSSKILNQPGHGAKNFQEFEAIEARLRAQKRQAK